MKIKFNVWNDNEKLEFDLNGWEQPGNQTNPAKPNSFNPISLPLPLQAKKWRMRLGWNGINGMGLNWLALCGLLAGRSPRQLAQRRDKPAPWNWWNESKESEKNKSNQLERLSLSWNDKWNEKRKRIDLDLWMEPNPSAQKRAASQNKQSNSIKRGMTLGQRLIGFAVCCGGRLGLVSFFGGYGLLRQPMLRKEKKRAPTSPTSLYLSCSSSFSSLINQPNPSIAPHVKAAIDWIVGCFLLFFCLWVMGRRPLCRRETSLHSFFKSCVCSLCPLTIDWKKKKGMICWKDKDNWRVSEVSWVNQWRRNEWGWLGTQPITNCPLIWILWIQLKGQSTESIHFHSLIHKRKE